MIGGLQRLDGGQLQADLGPSPSPRPLSSIRFID